MSELVSNPFIPKLKLAAYTDPLPSNEAKVLLLSLILEKRGESLLKEDKNPIQRIVENKIEMFKLPISFTEHAMMVLELLAGGNPGKAVVILIDSLTSFHPLKTVITAKDICDLYPWGFYKFEIFGEYLDFLKKRTVLWSEVL